ncbi:Spo0B domain-containing protein [Alicyclobacillus mali (ex Roth et al. 2021)]|uniref:Spo0B domain-containing protein n=1 Tax=Alicyclobacillus mali (ex Roth et al. 2021) TaxID=1123961 RepID=UPI0008355427|nr:Spo0B domain-containing protein [Alicyclobacillus mali (ex Roth et al. 2021)]
MADGLERGAGLEAFRRHRHDVLNQLQIVRALIQMNRADRAIAAIDRIAAWLQSLGRVQQAVPAGAEAIVWALAVCPHIVVDEIDVQGAPHGDALAEWISCMTELEARLAVNGDSPRMKLTVDAEQMWVHCDADLTQVEELQVRYPRIRFSRR